MTIARDVRFLTEEPAAVTIIDSDTEAATTDRDNDEIEQQSEEVPGRREIDMNRERWPGIMRGMDESNVLPSLLRERNENVSLAMAMIAVSGEPTTFDEAKRSPDGEKWLAAMSEEFDSLISNGTWELVKKPTDQKIVDNKWVFKVKEHPSGKDRRYKARLVVRGFTQEYGIDYMETFSPVVRFTSLRAVFAVVAAYGLDMMHFDVKTAFLNGDLEEVVFMKQPPGFDDGSGRVCKLVKSLYGLKQASRCWNRKFKSMIELFGFNVCDSDPCVFVSYKTGKMIILAIYVDDGIIAGERADIELVLKHLKEQFEITTMDVSCFLGFEIERLKDGSIFMHQSAYAAKVLEKFGMVECNAVGVPSDPNQVLGNHGDSEPSKYPYRQLVGNLMYMAVATRPDISYAIGSVSRHLENPTVTHENALKRILKYVKGTLDFGILFHKVGNNKLCDYSDADYAGDVVTRRSTSGSAFLFNDGIISWHSGRQKCVSMSTTESEYVAASDAVKELVWLRRLFSELLPERSNEMASFNMDNQSAIRLIKNPEFHKRTKHIDVRFHFIREKFEEGLFDLQYISTHDMVADVFTKPLARDRFEFLRNLLGMISIRDLK